MAESSQGQLIGGQITITKMVKQMRENSQNVAKQPQAVDKKRSMADMPIFKV